MAAKTANVLARVEPDVKKEAEEIMSQLGVPVSVVINMLYKQIILKKSIPFSLSLPTAPKTREEMDAAEFNRIIEIGLKQAQEGKSLPAQEVFSALKQEIEND